MWIMSNIFQIIFISFWTVTFDVAKCDAISNANFNSHIRDYSADINNVTNAKTLQKEDLGKYATFTPAGNPITFKEITDSALSSSSNSRGLLYHEQPGYDYEDGSHYTHGHDYHPFDPHSDAHNPHSFDHDHNNYQFSDHHPHDHYDPHGYNDHHGHGEHHGHGDHHGHNDHHDSHDHGHHHGYHHTGHHHSDHGHYDKHFKHALAAKTVLWPIAGIALLGAAAALVSNPVLLQLGVVSGKRRRRDTEEITGPDFSSDTFIKYAEKIKKQSNEGKIQFKDKLGLKSKKQNTIEKGDARNEHFNRRLLKTDLVKSFQSNIGMRKVQSSVKRNIDQVATSSGKYKSDNDDDRFIPIPIKLRIPKDTE